MSTFNGKKLYNILLSPFISIKWLFDEAFNTNRKSVILTLSLFFFIIGLCIYPLASCDLTNYWTYIDTYYGKEIFEIWNLNYTNLFVIDFVFWIISNFLSKEFFSGICGLVIFYVMFRICFSIVYHQGITDFKKYLILLLGFLTINLPLVYSSGRNFTAIAIFCLALFREFFEGEKNWVTYSLYVIPLFIHETMLIYLLIRLIITCLKRFNLVFINVLLIIFIFLLPQLVNISYHIINSMSFDFYLIDHIKLIISKAYSYFNLADGEYITLTQSLYYIVQKILYTIILVFSIIYANYSLYIFNKKDSFKKSISNIVLYSIIISYIGLCFSLFVPGNIYCRYIMVPMLVNIILMIKLNSSIVNKYFKFIFMVLYILYFVLAFYLFINLLEVHLDWFLLLSVPILVVIYLRRVYGKKRKI